MKQFCFLLLFFCSLAAHAQTVPAIEWQQSFGGTSTDEPAAICGTSDDGYIAVGTTYSTDGDVIGNHGSLDCWVTKIASGGVLIWQRCFGGTHEELASAVAQTKDDGYIIAGRTNSNDGDVAGNHSTSNDAWVIKLNSAGFIEWSKCFGGTSDDNATSVKQTIDGGYIVAGSTNSNNGDVSGNHSNTGFSDMWVIKLDSAGNILWQKCYGGSYSESASAIEQTKDSGYIVCGVAGSINGDVVGLHNSSDYWVVKLDKTGNLVWQKCLGGTSYDNATAITQLKDSGYVVAGNALSSNGDVTGYHGGNGDYWIVKLTATGTIVWEKCFGGSAQDQAISVQQTFDGNIMVAGFSSSADGDVVNAHGGGDYWALKLDSSGNLLWQKTLGGTSSDIGTAAMITKDFGYIITGSSQSNDGDVTGHHGNSLYDDFWIVKLKPEINPPTVKFAIVNVSPDCSAISSIVCRFPGNNSTLSVQLYRFGKKYHAAVNVTDSKHTFKHLPDGVYYATATIENTVITGQSKETTVMPEPTGAITSNMSTTKATAKWDLFTCAKYYIVQYRKFSDTAWKTKNSETNSFTFKGLEAGTNYKWRVAAADSANEVTALSNYSAIQQFTTATNLLNSIAYKNETAENIQAYPNPAITKLHVTLQKNYSSIIIAIKDLSGRIIFACTKNGINAIDIDVSKLQTGMYILQLSTGHQIIHTQKIFISH